MKKILFILLIFTIFIPFSGARARKKVKDITVKGLEVVDQSEDYIQVNWDQINNTRVKFSQVKVQRKTSSGKYKLVKRVKTKRRTINKKIVSGLSPAQDYYFRVRACRTKSNCGAWSDRVKGTTEPEFIIKNLIVDFAPYNSTTGRAGAFIFHGGLSRVFYEFVYTDGELELPTFEYIVASDAQVYSPINGVVTEIDWQETSQDYEVHLNPIAGHDMTVVLDHVLNLAVTSGDEVTAGDVIGNPGTWSGDDYGRVELEVFGNNYMYCPFKFFDPDTTNEYQQKVSQLMSDWESFVYNDSIYDEASMADYAFGCNAWQY